MFKFTAVLFMLSLAVACSDDRTVCSLEPYAVTAFKTYSAEKQAYMSSCLHLDQVAYCESFDHCLERYSKLGVKEEPSQPMSLGTGIAVGAGAIGAAHVIGKILK